MDDRTRAPRDELHRLLSMLMREDVEPSAVEEADSWWVGHRQLSGRFEHPFDLAVAGGFFADRLAWAFGSGYQAALRSLLPGLDPNAKVALAATERGGNHPREIHAALAPEGVGWRLSGTKEWATFGSLADVLLVAASEGRLEDGRNRLALVAVPVQRQGIRVETLPATPFAPELPHARVQFDGTPIDPADRLPGDGYEDYVKPFRTVEDLHVHGALFGWLVQVGRRAGWPESVLQELLLLVDAGRGLSRASASSPAIHLALAGLIESSERLLARLSHYDLWARVDEPSRRRWERDRRLLEVASSARERRLRTAWNRVRMTH